MNQWKGNKFKINEDNIEDEEGWIKQLWLETSKKKLK